MQLCTKTQALAFKISKLLFQEEQHNSFDDETNVLLHRKELCINFLCRYRGIAYIATMHQHITAMLRNKQCNDKKKTTDFLYLPIKSTQKTGSTDN